MATAGDRRTSEIASAGTCRSSRLQKFELIGRVKLPPEFETELYLLRP